MVCISRDGIALNEKFEHYETGNVMRFEEYNFRNNAAVVFQVVECNTGNFGVLIIFTKKVNMTCNTIAHEATHAAGYIFKHIRQEIDSDETFAYLVGWIAGCCWQVRNGKFK